MRLAALLAFALLSTHAARAEGLKENILAQAKALAHADRPYSSREGLVCNQFVSTVLRESKAAGAPRHSLSIDALIEYLKASPEWSWTARASDDKVNAQVSDLAPGDIVFMARDGDKTACGSKVEIPQVLMGGEENHVAVVVAVSAGAVQFAEAGNKKRPCLKAIEGRLGGGTRIEEYSSAFVQNTLFGFARAKQ